MNIRFAVIGDLPEIVEIYNQSVPSFQSTADMDPVTVQDRRTWFCKHSPEHYPLFVAELSPQIAGWCSISPWREGRRALFQTGEISFYIHDSFKRRGIASKLIEHAVAYCPSIGIRNLLAILLEVNSASLRLLRKHGFEEWGYLPSVADFDGSECGQFICGRRL
jgi:L-amino acid N-acyltransferase YncA